MSATSAALIEKILHVLERRVAGGSASELAEELGESAERISAATAEGIGDEILEHWPFWPERIRATARATSPFLRDLADLRGRALPFLERMSAASGWPATLHLLVPGAHAVVERFPGHGDAEEIAREQARYATPRSLRSGATAMAIVAHLADAPRAALLDRLELSDRAPQLAEIRAQGYCLSRGVDVTSGWILSAPLRAPDGVPYGALCTYGVAGELDEGFAKRATETVLACAIELSKLVRAEAVELRARAIIAEMTEPR
ncbi:MAG: hypothetical protein JNJ73_21055 [Hyphomonadaceae bacterium]|nr:hypothetical protein [Hyphomonadaceae bacterium]